MLNTEELKYLPKGKFLRERPIMLLTDCPLALEMQKKLSYSSQSASMMFSDLGKVGVGRLNIHASYLFNFRPEKGDLSALFHMPGLPVTEYTAWPQAKKDSILNFAYNDLVNLREEIAEVQPSLIICAGRWSLYFLTGETTLTETKKTQYGTLLKWRASHLELGSFWDYDKPHVVVPILPAQATWNLPDYAMVMRQDLVRISILSKAAIAGEILPYTEAGRNFQFIVEPTFKQVKDFFFWQLALLEASSEGIYYAVDVETRQGYHDCIGIAWSETEAICIPWATRDSPCYWSEAEEKELIGFLRAFLLHKHCKQIGQNYWYDMQYLWRDLGIKTVPSEDTMVQQHTLFAGLEKNLAFISSLYSKVYKFWKDEGAWHKGKSDLEHWNYNCKDCCYTYEDAFVLQKMLEASPKHIQKAYDYQLRETLPVLVNIMNRGVTADRVEKSRLSRELGEVCVHLLEDINIIVGEPFNPNSPPQKQALFYDLLQMPKQYDPKTKRLTVGAKALELFSEKYALLRPLISRLEEYAKLNKVRTTIIDSGLDIDNKLRTSYNMCGTDTWRLASSKNAFESGMNHQNVTSGGKTISGRVIPNCRELFIPDTGKIFFDSDLDSADLRIVVAISGASDLQQMLNEGLKPYVELMKEYYNDPTKNKNSAEYKIFKGFAHGTHYLGSSAGLAPRLGLLVHEVDKLQKWYLQRNPEIHTWHNELRKQVYNRGWIENVFGYRKYFFNKKFPTLMQVAAAWEPQSSVGLLINRGMVAIDNAYTAGELPVEVLLQVHDSLAGQYPIDRPDCKEKIIKLCEIELPYSTPITIPVDIHTSLKSWGGCK